MRILKKKRKKKMIVNNLINIIKMAGTQDICFLVYILCVFCTMYGYILKFNSDDKGTFLDSSSTFVGIWFFGFSLLWPVFTTIRIIISIFAFIGRLMRGK